MARPDKAASVAEITEAFTSSGAAVITEYRGLTVAEMKELRRSLGGDTQYAVVKNTLTKIAAKQAGLELDELLQGPTAIAFIKGDPVEAAKGLRDFAKAHPLLVIKGGVLDAKAMSAAEIRKLAGAMNASLQQAVSLFAAPLSQAARLAAALRDKVEAEGGAAAAAAETEATADEAPAEEAPAAEASETEAPAAEASETEAPAAETTETETEAAAEPAAEPTAEQE